MPSPVLWGDEATVRERLGSGVSALRQDLVSLWATHNRATEPNQTLVDAEYLDVVATR
jgi:hypothetical protein